MKEFIKKTLLLTVMIIFAAYLIPMVWGRNTSEGLFLLQLLFLSTLLCLVQLITKKWSFNYYLLELVVEYIMVLTIVFVVGIYFQWFQLSSYWMVLCYVTPVYILGYFLDIVKTRKDVEIINEEIKKRQERKKRQENT